MNLRYPKCRRPAVVVLLLAVAACAGVHSDELPAAAFTTQATLAAGAARVVRVIDGDTYILVAEHSTFRLRLVGVDAPELGQPFGRQAADSVARLLPAGRVVLVARAGLDLYGRTLGAVLLPVSTVAAEGRPVPLDSLVVARGWAWASDEGRVSARLAGQQSAAQRRGLGLWKCGPDRAVSPKRWRSFNAQNKRRYRGTCSW